MMLHLLVIIIGVWAFIIALTVATNIVRHVLGIREKEDA